MLKTSIWLQIREILRRYIFIFVGGWLSGWVGRMKILSMFHMERFFGQNKILKVIAKFNKGIYLYCSMHPLLTSINQMIQKSHVATWLSYAVGEARWHHTVTQAFKYITYKMLPTMCLYNQIQFTNINIFTSHSFCIIIIILYQDIDKDSCQQKHNKAFYSFFIIFVLSQRLTQYLPSIICITWSQTN